MCNRLVLWMAKNYQYAYSKQLMKETTDGPSLDQGWRPLFLREIREYANDGKLPQGIHTLLDRDGVGMQVSGDMDQLSEHRGGMLFVGDHQHQWEFVAATALAHTLGRDDMHHVAKFYVKRQIRWALGATAAESILPVYPRILASDRGEFLNTETVNRIVFRRHLLTKAEAAAENERVLGQSSEHLANGGTVNIYPCGSIVDWSEHTWRSGVGRIISGVPGSVRQETLVVPYRLDGLSRNRLIANVVLRGRLLAPETMRLQLGEPITAQRLVDMVGEDPDAITDRLRTHALSTTNLTPSLAA